MGSAFYWSAVYPLVHTGSPQVLVRSLPVGQSAGPQVHRSALCHSPQTRYVTNSCTVDEHNAVCRPTI